MPFSLHLSSSNDGSVKELDRIILQDSSSSARAEMVLFGATVVSWRCETGDERLFVSSLAKMDGSKAIRGGIPIVFPHFGQPKPELVQHGFARNSMWTIKEDSMVAGDESASVILSLSDSDVTRAVFPFHFSLSYTVTLTKNSLTCSLSCANTDASAWECHTLLHTYLAVPSVHAVRIDGFQNRPHMNKVKGGLVETADAELALVDREVDKVFVGTLDAPMRQISLLLDGAASSLSRTLTCAVTADLGGQRIKHDVVFWNAWVEKSRALADLDDDAYLRYVCIEPGTVSEFVAVPPGVALTLTQTLS